MTDARRPARLGAHLAAARNLLCDVVDLLDTQGIPYHLEGGTLLGVVRDGELLAWDHDIDLSIPAECGEALLKLRAAFLRQGHRTSIRRSALDAGPIRKGALSLFKVKPLAGYLKRAINPRHDFVVVDVFIKTRDAEYTYWQAKGRVMRVANKYYESFDTVSFGSRRFRVPNQYQAYLTEKYGNWRVPVQDWDCAKDELTVIDRQRPDEGMAGG